MVNKKVKGCSIPGIKYSARPTRLPVVPGMTGEYPERKPVAMNREKKETLSLLGFCDMKEFDVLFKKKFSVVEEIEKSCSYCRECHD